MNCIWFMNHKNTAKKKAEHDSIQSIKETHENNAFNTVNRSLSVNLITADVNDAAQQFLKAYGKLPVTARDEASAKLLFVQLVSSKAARIAASGFDRAIRHAKSPFDESYSSHSSRDSRF